MLRKIIKLKRGRSFLRKMKHSEWVWVRHIKICRLKKNMFLAGVGALICSAVGGIAIAFVVAFLSSLVEEIYDIGIYDRKLSVNIGALKVLFGESFSLNSNEKSTHPRDKMLSKANTSPTAPASLTATTDIRTPLKQVV